MKTILLIDDEEDLRTTFSAALQASGYRVIEADSGVTGLHLARQHLPGVILTDIHMPGGDGSTLLRDIRQDPALRATQVVLMTGRPDLVTPRRGMEDGADDFLVKPVGIKALLSCMEARFSRASISWRVEDQMLARLKSTVPHQLPHEFFTPLAGIIGLMEILRDNQAQMTPAEIGDIHGDVYKSALQLHRTLRNYLLILDLQNAPQDGEPPAPLAPADVQANIQTGIGEALRLNSRRDDITVQAEAVSLAILPGDLARMVEELVDNACKFSRQGTPVTVVLSADRRLTVTDQGRGMSAEEIEHIGAFQQFDRKKHEQQGLGLGLVLVQKSATLCKAEFSISSEPGKGTTVQLAFPQPAAVEAAPVTQ